MKRRHSISTRLVALFLISGVVMLILVRGAFRLAFDSDLSELLRPHLNAYIGYLVEDLGRPPQRQRAQELAAQLPLDVQLNSPQATWSTADELIDPRQLKPVRRGRHTGSTYWLETDSGRHLVIRRSQPNYDVYFLVRRDSGGFGLALALGLGAIVLILVLTYHAIRRLFRPIHTIRADLARIGGGDLTHRVRLLRRDELGELADSINGMVADLERLLEAKRNLLFAVSHELRSPLTRARLHLELMPDSDHKFSLGAEISRLEQLLDELLETERLDGIHSELQREAVVPGDMVAEVIRESFPDNDLDVRIAGGDIAIMLDRARCRLLIRNLIDNALRHTPQQAPPPRIESSTRNGQWRLSVEDHGAGIAPRHLPHVTEPFYRADPSRQHETGGYGLGLYLCRRIAEAHGGTIKVENRPGSGIRVSIALPGTDPG